MNAPAKPKSGKAKLLPETVGAIPEHSPHEIKKEANPFTDPDWRMLGYAWSGFALRVLLIVGALFSVFQFLQAREERRVERSLQLVDIWERPEYQQAQRALKRRLTALNEQYANLLGSNPSATELAIYHERIGMEAMKAGGGEMPLPEFRDQFDRILYFLNRLSFCVKGNLCSREVVDEVFGDFARSFWTYFSGFIEVERKRGSPGMGKPLEEYLAAG